MTDKNVRKRVVSRSPSSPSQLTTDLAKQSINNVFPNPADPEKQWGHQQALLASLVLNSKDFIGVASLDGTALFMNDHALRLVGLDSITAGLQTQIKDYFFLEDHPFLFDDFFPRVLKEGHGAVEIRFRHFQTGAPIWVNYAVFTVPDPDTGKPMALATVTRDISGQKVLENEQKRLLADLQQQEKKVYDRAEREALLNEIGEVVRNIQDPVELQSAAVALLGARLGADRCYFITYSFARDDIEHHSRHGHIAEGRDWHRSDLPSINNVFTPENAVRSDDLFRMGTTVAINDLNSLLMNPQLVRVLAGFSLRSLLAVPFFDLGKNEEDFGGNLVAALILGMADDPRTWTQEEISLVEVVAALTRSAAGAARAQLRERNIARQLQNALTPALPHVTPGLEIDHFYKPALEEAEVGGDFIDVFALGATCTAIVVGDLAGKGLAAAQQVATVRTMLRYALYSSSTSLAKSIEELNQILVENELVAGFATLFVGLYDAIALTLTYVNCGQEPGLIWQAKTGTILELSPTGPVLGGFVTGTFAEQTIQLSSQDIIAIFTDGLTEVGPNRREQLEIRGVSALFGGCCAAEPKSGSNTYSIQSCLISEVDNFARGGIRDDVALLIGVITGDTSLSALQGTEKVNQISKA